MVPPIWKYAWVVVTGKIDSVFGWPSKPIWITPGCPLSGWVGKRRVVPWVASVPKTARVFREISALISRVFEVQAQDGSAVHGVDKRDVVYLRNAPAPITPVGGVFLFVHQADNKLKYRGRRYRARDSNGALTRSSVDYAGTCV